MTAARDGRMQAKTPVKAMEISSKKC